MTSEVCDLWRERDGVYLRVDGRAPAAGKAGEVPGGTREAVVRVSSAARGRDWPGRWTLLEVEVRSSVSQRVSAGFVGEQAREVELRSGEWSAVRVPVSASLADVQFRRVGGPALDALELRKVRLVDDAVTLGSTGSGAGESGLRVERRAGYWRFSSTSAVLPVIAESGETYVISEINPLRAIVSLRGTEVASVYRSGLATQVLSSAGTSGSGMLRMEVPEDEGRVDRGTTGDRDGDGFNEVRGCFCVKAAEGVRRMTLNVVPGPTERHAYIEIARLPAGKVTALWAGKVLETPVRLADGRVLLELPALQSASRIEVSVEPERDK